MNFNKYFLTALWLLLASQAHAKGWVWELTYARRIQPRTRRSGAS